MITKFFEILINNRLADYFKKCSPFPGFQYGSRSSQLTSDLLIVVSDRIFRGPGLLRELGFLVFLTK